MPEPTTTTSTAEDKELFVDVSEAFVDLLKIPDKPTRLQKLGGSPSRWIGIILLMIIWGSSAVHYKHEWNNSHITISSLFGASTVQQYPSVTLTKYSWAEIDTTGKKFRGASLNPPVRRLVMVDDNPDRIYPLPPGVDNSIDLGISRSLKFKIDPSEEHTFSKFEYELR